MLILKQTRPIQHCELQAEGSQKGEVLQQPGVVRGYGVLNTPAFTPGPEQSPLMTWGDIGSTPIRLDQEDDIHVSTSTGECEGNFLSFIPASWVSS